MFFLLTHQERAISLSPFLPIVSSIIHLATNDLEWLNLLPWKAVWTPIDMPAPRDLNGGLKKAWSFLDLSLLLLHSIKITDFKLVFGIIAKSFLHRISAWWYPLMKSRQTGQNIQNSFCLDTKFLIEPVNSYCWWEQTIGDNQASVLHFTLWNSTWIPKITMIERRLQTSIFGIQLKFPGCISYQNEKHITNIMCQTEDCLSHTEESSFPCFPTPTWKSWH